MIEPTGPAWLPVAVFFGRRGHAVYGVPSAKAADLRPFLSRRPKSNAIDAATLARLVLVDPQVLRPLELPGADWASLERRVRAATASPRPGPSTSAGSRISSGPHADVPPRRGPHLVRPGQAGALRGPERPAQGGEGRLSALISRASPNQLGAERAEQWLAAARASLALYAGDSAVAFSDLVAEVATEVRLLQAVEAEFILWLNEGFGGDLSEADRLHLEGIGADMAADPEIQQQAAVNAADNFGIAFDNRFKKAITARMNQAEELTIRILDTPELQAEITRALMPRV